jgi:hypothetical protein
MNLYHLGKFTIESAIGLSILCLIIAGGLWQRKSWARWAMMILAILGVMSSFFSASVALSGVWDSFYGYSTYPPLQSCVPRWWALGLGLP